MFGPHLIGERVRLAPITVEMLPTFCAWFADQEITRYLTLQFPPTVEMEREWYDKMSRSANDLLWAIFVGEKLIGTTGLHQIHWPTQKATTGNLLGAKEDWGKGYGTEAVALRTRFAFEQLNLQKLSTHVLLDNIGSRRVLEKNGYRQIGIARREYFSGGKWHDIWLAEVLKEEWQALQANR